MEHTYRLVISCPDRVGNVAKVSKFLSTYNVWITEASHNSVHQACHLDPSDAADATKA